eukprot:COSAG06_NODE_43313_length_373_cov_0.744526_1_plen_77_part_10
MLHSARRCGTERAQAAANHRGSCCTSPCPSCCYWWWSALLLLPWGCPWWCDRTQPRLCSAAIVIHIALTPLLLLRTA